MRPFSRTKITKQRAVMTMASVAMFAALFLLVTSGNLGMSELEINQQPATAVISDITANKHGWWAADKLTLVSDPEAKTGVKLPEATSQETIDTLLKAGVNLETHNSLSDFMDTSKSKYYLIAAIVASISSLALAVYGAIVLSGNKSQEGETDKLQKATLGGGKEAVIDFTNPDTTFADVAGADEAVESLRELSDFLKNPERYHQMGVRIPKGAVLSGPPGTGKTLIARALAGEAGVPFFTASGSEFVETYVGVGAKRVRELFSKMREHPVSILFIDEIDAVARKRSTGGSSSGSQESESTLNQLLTEIDGFDTKGGEHTIMVIAATNRVDLLDPAITRSGRLERKIQVPNPDRRGREKILAVHVKGKPLSDNVDLPLIAARTPGFSGADMATIANEAGLIAIKRGLTKINQSCFDQAIADVAMGPARTSAQVTEEDRLVTAWHEAGHTLCAFIQPEHDDPVAVSITPRGPAGGVTWMSGSDAIFLSRNKAISKIVTAFGGRVGEEMLLNGEYTQGASGDFQAATEIALAMVTKYGMTDLGYQVRPDQIALSNENVTAEVEKLLIEGKRRAEIILSEHRGFFQDIVDLLMEQNDVSYAEILEIGKRHGVKHTPTMVAVPAVPSVDDADSGDAEGDLAGSREGELTLAAKEDTEQTE